MKTIYKLLLFSVLLLASVKLTAQAQYNVTGVVTNEKGEPLKSATVFIGGTERIMPTDENGRFNFNNVPTGTFQLSVQMLGYAPLARNIIVKDGPLNLELQLATKAIRLDEVVIGKKNAWDKNFKLFKENFLGQSDNAKQCVILNPKAISFSTKKGLLLADADDFLIIENKRLGYRIHYQLKDFGYNSKADIALYHGECSFEQMDGTSSEKKKWAKNRLATYQGSFMHFLRSVHADNTLENGFITKPLYGFATLKYNDTTVQLSDRIIIKDSPVMFDSLITALDTNFTSFKFRRQLYVIYNPKIAARFKITKSDLKQSTSIDKKGSLLRLATDQAIIDKKGSYTDYRDFYIHGYWAKARVGDQLPVEYQPPFAVSPRRDEALNQLTNILQKWTVSIPQEKAYLHLDKPYYAPGDTIWFKGYLTTGSRHQLSALSGAVYVDLADEQGLLIKSLKLPATSGMVQGDFVLGDDLKEGAYRIRAYTQWMRNAGEDYFFDHIFTVGNPAELKKGKEFKNNFQRADIQFFPESGNLVNGITSRVAFKAVGGDGLGTAISGRITDNEHNEITEFATLHAGMGSFSLRPLSGRSYTAQISFADGTTKSIALPKALDDGYVLSVYQPNKDSILVRLNTTASLQPSTVNLISQSSGETIFASAVKITSPITSIWLYKKSFSSGIAQFTIFNSNNEPLNERIAFIKGDDRMQLAVSTAKTIYKSREQVQLNLSANNGDHVPAAGFFSVAVTDESKVPVDESVESTIFSNILLTSDLKGYIEKPNYYFTADTGEINRALDNLMLTQGYRRFEWKLLDSTLNTKPAFAVEGLGTTISGLVTTLNHKPLPNASVSLMSIKARVAKDTITDANGRFKFDKMFLSDSIKFAVQARDTKNSDNVIIVVDSVPRVSITRNKNMMITDTNKTRLQAAAQNDKIAHQIASTASKEENTKAIQDDKKTSLNKLHTLKQVDINTRKAKEENSHKGIALQEMFSLPDEASADKVITVTEPDSYTNLEMFLRGRLQGISIETDKDGFKQLVIMGQPEPVRLPPDPRDPYDPYYGKTIGLIVNGRKLLEKGEIDDVLEGSILPEDVAKIEVVRKNRAMVQLLQGGDRYVGYVLILTKPPSARKQYNPAIANITPKGFNKVRRFYSPRYDRPDVDYKQPDRRTTIYWNPYVNTDETGKATLDFYNAHGPGTYRVVVEGINAAGELGRQVYTYAVE
ncbi:carboxypeptidase regulatory-like domain-containing protein [Mucilaginibacter sp. UR6-11]|uniref:carboxypeptidase regulatory-like domain-containing protein n=1 Tax=Mucilaginibacter sp. UR6-11 TaxID=1435644 RepID=UPI001E613007|nr:carboxypeptidase regulatory-like domain-containing protein [Mucilaginibacter sp. UR6-11]MCC8427185.1 carboxypeptidase-like regulatory domain-containing protein [Mucilaginibacter sp. UR6-11]